ncbi:MAG: malic enzyme-like NAD(P)-binding protein [Acholeplasmataceae bacterium]
MNIYDQAIKKHREWKGKLTTTLKMPLENKNDLSLAYTPGVAAPCLEIQKDETNVYQYTSKGNLVAVITDGSAVLGLGDIGPAASLPVMEGKAALFKRFADIDAVSIALDTKDTEKIIETIAMIAPSFGGINLEDISAPRCVEIERALVERLDIPVFHDDQHGTAIVVTAAVINALKLVEKPKESLKVIVSGTGAAGSAVIKMLYQFGIKNILAYNKKGLLMRNKLNEYDKLQKEIAMITNPNNVTATFEEAFDQADMFIGVSVKDLVTKAMIKKMNDKPIIFALANPDPEITYQDALDAGAYIVGTGRSDHPNQINNVLAFPGLFRGALDVRATKITEAMKLAAAYAIADCVNAKDLSTTKIMPSVFDHTISTNVAEAVKKAV